MTITGGLRLGGPGVYRAPPREPDIGFADVRLDVTGFVGVCLRGPVNGPVRVAGWSDFQRRFGGVADPDGRPCPGQLPTAVQLYFAQGGAVAWITRVGPPEDSPAMPTPAARVASNAGTGGDAPVEQTPPLGIPPATAGFRLGTTDYLLAASDPGSWGNRLDIRLEFDDSTRFTPLGRVGQALEVPDVPALPLGSLLRIRGKDLPAAGSLHWVTSNSRAPGDRTRRRRVAVEPRLPEHCDVEDVSVITATLVVVDTDPTFDRTERLTGLGLHPDHPRYPSRVLPELSTLVRPVDGQTSTIPPASALLPALPADPIASGIDRWAAIDRRSFFDDGPADADLLDEQLIHRGVDAAGRVEEIGLLCVPDLSWRWQPTPLKVESAVPARYDPCGRLVSAGSPAVRYQTSSSQPDNRLDPADRDELQELVERQQRLVDVAQLRRRFVAMLDVPRGLPITEITRWRTAFDSSFAAAYHPWLGVAGPRPSAPTIFVAPSVFACGITASRERRLGLPWGPANELATSVVTAADLVTDEIHDQLHQLGVNAFRSERDGFRLTAARTLSTDPDYVQLSVRRVMTTIALSLVRQSQWLVFEPNTQGIRTALSQSLIQFLGALFRRGAFTGDSERQAFFVRCDETINTPSSLAQGRLIAEIGVAPAAPMEYLVLRVAQDTDGALRVEAAGD